MLKKYFPYFIFFGCLLLIIAFAVAQEEGENKYSALAERIVNQCANIQEGDNVWIVGSVRDMALLEELAVKTRKTGAFPVIQVGSEQMAWRMFNERPAKYDSQTRGLALKLAEIVDVQINVSVGENLNLFADVDPQRLAIIRKAYQPVNMKYVERNVRGVDIGNAMYPTENLAKRWGVKINDLSKLFWNGVSADYKQIENSGKQLKAKLSAIKELHLTHPNGTDLKMNIANRPVFVSDGIITEEDMQAGYAASQVYLPAGEVMVTPVPGSATGKVVINRLFYAGKEISDLTLSFEKGKLVSMTSESDITRLKADYDAADAGKEDFALIDIGINPEIGIIPDSKMTSWVPAGMITIGIGNNSWAGGDNNSAYALYGHLEGSTVTLDGSAFVTDGHLNL